MEKNTKIIVLHAKALIYTGIFIGLTILLILLIVLMLKTKGTSDVPVEETANSYVAGIYKSSIMLNNTPIDVTVTVDSNHINSIDFVNLSDSIATMYPLLQPSLDNIASQVCEKQSTKDITYSEESKYTSALLIDAIDSALDEAAP